MSWVKEEMRSRRSGGRRDKGVLEDPTRVRRAWREASVGGSTREGGGGGGGAEGDGEGTTGLRGK